MKKVLILLAVVALIVWVISWFRVPEAVATSGTKEWPGGMGSLENLAKRYPAQEENAAAKKLTELANALPKNEAVDEYVGREIARDELTIGQPPALPEVSAIRELLLRESIVWPRPAGIAEVGDQGTSSRRGMQMTLARLLIASALTKARANDPAAWEDLHAVWNLARSLDAQPQMMAQTAAFSMPRMINAVAWKMPLPAPQWFGELPQRDYVRPLLEAFQYQTASYWQDGAQMFPTKWHADGVEHDRRIAVKLFTETKCDVTAEMNTHGTDLRFVWDRAFRYRAEREATANAIRLREHKPIQTKSTCTDGTWTLEGTTLRFSRPLPTEPPDAPMPLVLKVKETAQR